MFGFSMFGNQTMRFGFFLQKVCSKYLRYIVLRKFSFLEIYLEKFDLLVCIDFLVRNTFIRLRTLSELVGVDLLKNLNRFKLVYLFLPERFPVRISIAVFVQEGEMVPSLSRLYKSANWSEREV